MTLYVRALSPISLSTSQTGTGTEFKLDQNSSKLLPLWVAQEAGFQRLWTAGKVQVATDSGFSNVVTSIPAAETETVTTVNGYAGAVTLAASDVGLGNVTNTSDATKNSAVAALTNKDLTSGTNTFPAFNQNTTGNAATATKLATARNINGVAFDGSAAITVADSTKEPVVTAGTTAQYYRGDKSWQTLNAGAVGITLPSGAIVGTSDTQAITNKDLTSGTNTFPTFNQNTTGSAAKLTTARTINGTSFDGSANITIITDNSDGTATTVS